MRFGDIIYAFPDLLFFIIVMTALRDTPIGQALNGLILLFAALSIVNWVGLARLVRGQVLSLRRKEFVEAARMIGSSTRASCSSTSCPTAWVRSSSRPPSLSRP